MIAARTYNLAPAGTFGQNLEVYGVFSMAFEGDSASIPGVINSADYRTNLGLLTTSKSSAAVIELRVYDQGGALVAMHPDFALDPEQYAQFDVFSVLGLGDLSLSASVEVTVLFGGPVAVYASVVDNRTQDPVLIPGQVGRY